MADKVAKLYQGKWFSMMSDAGNDAVAKALEKHVEKPFEKDQIMSIIGAVQKEVSEINPEQLHPSVHGGGEMMTGFSEVGDTAVRESMYMYLNYILDKDE